MYKEQILKLLADDKKQEALDYLEDYCQHNPADTAAKFDLAMLLINTSIYTDGFMIAQELLDDIERHIGKTVKTTVLKAHIEKVYTGQIKDNTFLDMDSLLSYGNDTYSNQLHYLKAKYWSNSKTEYIKCLKDSIEADPDAVYNFLSLGRETGNIDYYVKAIKNVKEICDENVIYDPLNFDDLVNEFIRGTSITDSVYKPIKEEVEKALK